MADPSIELVMSEFGFVRQNAGGARLGYLGRLNPTLKSFRQIFPAAEITLYTDQDFEVESGVRVVRVDSPFDRNELRYGWRSHDYFQAIGLLKSSADVAIAMDSDFEIVSRKFFVIARLAEIFGLAIPVNPRLLLKIDGGIGLDSPYDPEADDTLGLGMVYNMSPIAFSTKHGRARALLERYCRLQEERPGRGPVHMTKATYELGYQPCVLPPQWSICSPRDLDSKHIWSEAIALHVGHRDVRPRWRREQLKSRLRGLLRNSKGKK